VQQIAQPNRFSSALINVSLSDTSARNIQNRLHYSSGTIRAVWRVDSFARTVAELFPLSEEWHFWDNTQQSVADEQKDCADRTTNLSAEQIWLLLSCFVLVSVGDAFCKFSPLSPDDSL